jgi:transposase
MGEMYKIRQIEYSSNSVSIQVYTIKNRRRVILRHIGTARTEKEKADLIALANEFIEKISKQLSLFENKDSGKIFNVSQTDFIGVYYGFYYEALSKLMIQIGFDKIRNPLLLDLSIMRIFEPASKLRSIELLEEYFGIKHRRQSFYEFVPRWLDLKGKIENIATSFARKNYSFNFDLLFYDVTTLYFETFQEDEFRKDGFSKDNKSQQPQILVALMVTKEGFPIAYEVFSGNTFEGHTILPVVRDFIRKNHVKDFTVVADAAMISAENIKHLNQNNINYIVGARLGNISNELFNKIDTNIIRKNGKTIRIRTELGYLICSYSSLRYRKDKHEMDNQVERAKLIVENPSKNKKLKFTKTSGQNIVLNQELIAKTQKLLGIKGYYTNLEETIASNQLIIERYHELYKIEQAFRISKHDLQTRPIFHFNEEPIKLHLIICFIALVISKHIELQTNTSIKKFVHECKKITDARLINKTSNKEFRIRAQISENISKYMKFLNLLT